MPSSAGDGVSAVSAQPKERSRNDVARAGDGVSAVSAEPKKRSRNAVARAAAFRLLGAYVQGWTVLEQCRSNCRGKRDSLLRDEFSRGRLILKRFRINWSRNWKTSCKSCYSSTLEFWHSSVYSTYTQRFVHMLGMRLSQVNYD